MNRLKGILSVIGLIVKYSAVVMAIIKGVETVYTELQKIDWDSKPDTKQVENE